MVLVVVLCGQNWQNAIMPLGRIIPLFCSVYRQVKMKCFPRWRHQAFTYAAIFTEPTEHAGSNGTTSEVYSKDAQFESRPGNRIFWRQYSWLTSVLGKCVDNRITTASFHIAIIHHHPTIRRYILRVTDGIIKWITNKETKIHGTCPSEPIRNTL
jgi:hypothetical protein